MAVDREFNVYRFRANRSAGLSPGGRTDGRTNFIDFRSKNTTAQQFSLLLDDSTTIFIDVDEENTTVQRFLSILCDSARQHNKFLGFAKKY